jgi:hypothetical protein
VKKFKVAILGCPADLKIYLGDNLDIAFIENHGKHTNWEFNDVRVPEFPGQSHWALAKYFTALDRLSNLGNVFARHWDDMPNQELVLRKLSLQIISLAEVLNENGIAWVIQFTSASHWLDSFILEIATEIAGAKSVFLNALLFKGRILPMVHDSGILSRQLLGARLTSYSFDDELNDSLLEYTSNQTTMALKPKSFLNSIFDLHKIYARFLLGRLKRLFVALYRRQPISEFNDLKSIGYLGDLRLLFRVKHALETLTRIQANQSLRLESKISDDSNKLPKIVIAAHYQPEASSFPLGGRFSNYVDLVINIINMGHPVELFFKEHPATYNLSSRVGTARSGDFYKQLESLGCKFISDFSEVGSEDEYVVHTLTGTVALERAMKGLVTLVDGLPFFAGMPGLITTEQYINQIKNGTTHKFQVEEVTEFLAELLNFKTISNAYGIGGYSNLNESDAPNPFDEFSRLLESLKAVEIQ